MLNEKEKLEQIIRLSAEMMEIKDLDLLMHRILTVARLFSNADAGSIYINHGDRLEFSYTQNETLEKKLPPGKKLVFNTFSIPMDTNTIAGYVATSGKILNISDVYALSEDVPYKFGKNFDNLSNYRTRSMLTMPMKTSQGTIIGVLQLINARDESARVVPFFEEEVAQVKHFANSAAVALERAQMTRTIILRMIGMAELRDPKETGAHVNRVAAYSTEIFEVWARRRGMSEDEIRKKLDILRMAAMLHDVGKVGISDLILKKPAKYTDEEYEIMKQHTIIGARLFANPKSDFDEAAAEVAFTHHERWDGKGYPGYVDPLTGCPLEDCVDEQNRPQGKAGTEIPIFGRVMAVADVYDALCSRRSYKEAWSEEDVIEDLQKQAGKHFDPELIEIFLSVHDVILSIKRRYADPE